LYRYAYNLGSNLALAAAGFKMAAAERMAEDEARKLGERIGIDWDTAEFTVAAFAQGCQVELEHGSRDPQTNVTSNDEEATGKIAWAHLKEDPEYYAKLAKMEKTANGDDEAPGDPVDKSKVIEWFKKNPNPQDAAVHSFAKEMNYNPHALESVIYTLATKAVQGMGL